MNAFVTGLGLLPLAVDSSSPGQAVEGPMAIVIVEGLITSTALKLFVLRHGRFEKPVKESI